MAAAPGTVATRVLYLVAFAFVTGSAWSAAHRRPTEQRRPWTLVAGALTVWLVGDVLAEAARLVVGHDLTSPEPSDVLWLLGYPLLAGGVLLMARRRAPGQLRAGVLDGLTLVTAAGIVITQTVVLPEVRGAGLHLSTVVPSLYPLGDVALLATALFLVLSPGRRGTATRLLVAALGLTLVVDLGFALPAVTSLVDNGRLDGLLLVANALLVASALHPGGSELTTQVPGRAGLHPTRVLFLGIALLTAPSITLATGPAPLVERASLLAATVATSALVLTRFTGAVRAQERAQEQLTVQAAHDSLTGAVNRGTLTTRIGQATRTATLGPALLYVDLDDFKSVNDTWGHEAGDAVLVETVRRLQATVRSTDTVSRLGGDEFAVLLADEATTEGVTALASRVVDALAEPVPFGAESVQVAASVGVAMPLPRAALDVLDSETDVEHLLRRADHAMYEAKRTGRGRWVLAT